MVGLSATSVGGTLVGLLLGTMLGAWWVRTFVDRPTERGKKRRLISVLSKRESELNLDDLKKIAKVAVEEEHSKSFKQEVISSNLLWALCGLSFAFVSKVLELGSRFAHGIRLERLEEFST